MCGILGKVFTGSSSIDRNRFKEALNLMNHRGPDEYELHFDKHLAFGHQRLSIIDLSTDANQPFHSHDGMVTIVFNGEIYNYQELKEELLSTGYKFKTNSDTEVLVSLFHRDGIKCVERLNGMFAIAVYDRRNNKTYLVRDRLGIKPLYYFENHKEGNLTFSSEIKSIIHLEKPITFSKNKTSLSSYLSFRYPILDDSYFENIHSLKAGHYLVYHNGNLSQNQYWNPSSLFNEQKNEQPEEYYIQRLKELLESSVKYRMISDVPVGAFLSGGVDSSVITAIMANLSTQPVKTFTIGFNEDGYNEFEYSRLIADRYKTDHQEIIISGADYINKMDDLISYKDAPLSVPNEIPLSMMAKELKKKVTVVLSGEGADEIFGGYGRIFRSPFDYSRSKSNFIDTLNASEKETLNKNLIDKYGRKSFDNELDHFYQLYSYTPVSKKNKMLTKEFQNENIENQFKSKFQFHFDELKDDSYTNKMMYTFEMIHLKGLLNRVDNATMYASVEARVPFVDHRLVEFAFSIPLKYKMKWVSDAKKEMSKLDMSSKISENADIPKYILKKAYEGIVNDEVLYRKKMGFPVPLNDWFGGSFNAYAKEILLDPSTINRGELNKNEIEKLLNDQNLKTNHSDAMHMWMLINNELFNRKYFSN
jgi:asparagine synthase (glutamine-hydrolysing)